MESRHHQDGLGPGFSTLEVDHRFSTLQVQPEHGHLTLEAVHPTVKEPSATAAAPLEPAQSANEGRGSIWGRYKIGLVVLSIVIGAGIIGGAVGGTLARRKDGDGSQNAEDGEASSSLESTTAPPSSSSEIESLHSSSTATTTTSVKPTATPDPDDTPQFPIYIGDGEREDEDEAFRLAFVDDGTSDAGCHWVELPVDIGTNPCGHPFLLLDGFEYVWNGCGGDTWVTWRNPSGDDNEYRKLHEGPCQFQQQTFQCDDVLVHAAWHCGNSTTVGAAE